MKKRLTEQEFINYVRGQAKEQGQNWLADALGFSAGYMSDVLTGRRKVSALFARVFHYKKVTTTHFDLDETAIPRKKPKSTRK